jgi:cytochrome P450
VSRPADDPSELSAAVATMFRAGEMNFWNVLQFLLPPLRYLPSARNRSIAHSRAVMDRIGRELLAQRKAAAACVFLSVCPMLSYDVERSAGAKSDSGRDILSLLVRANTAEDSAQRLSDEDVLARTQSCMLP